MGSHVEVKHATAVMGQHQKHIENLEADCGHSEEINGDQLRHMVLQERSPSLGRRFCAPHHILADAGLSDVDAEFEQFAMNARCAPTWVFSTHSAIKSRTARETRGRPG